MARSERRAAERKPLVTRPPKILHVRDMGQQAPIGVQPVTSNWHSFCWLAACCCWCPPSVFKNWPTERIRAIFCLTLKQVEIDLAATRENEASLTRMGLSPERYNKTITAGQPAATLAGRPPFTVTYGGHATIELNIGEHIILIDPTIGNVSDYERKIPEYFTAEKTAAVAPNTKVVLASHNHGDHNNYLEDPTIRAQQPTIIVGAQSRWPKEWGYRDVHTLKWGQKKRFEIAEGVILSVTGIPAQHSSARKGYGCGGCIPTAVINLELWLGFFIEIEYNGQKYNIYYTGDTGEGKHFQNADGETVTLKDYVVEFAKQCGGIDFIFAQVGPHEPFGDHGESPMHMGPEEIVRFSSEIIAAMDEAGERKSYIIPVHHSAFAYEKPRGYYLLQFLLEAAKQRLDRVIPLAFKGTIDLGEILAMSPDKIKVAFDHTVASLHQPYGIFSRPDVRDFYDIPGDTSTLKLHRTPSVENLGHQLADFTR